MDPSTQHNNADKEFSKPKSCMTNVPIQFSKANSLQSTPSTEQDVHSKHFATLDLPCYNRAFWVRRLKYQGPLKVCQILDCLGLRQSNERSSKRGRPKFDSQVITQLSDAVADIASKLPEDAEELISTAMNSVSLDKEVSGLLAKFGAMIWSKEKNRPWLLKASDGVKNYSKDLVYENLPDRAV